MSDKKFAIDGALPRPKFKLFTVKKLYRFLQGPNPRLDIGPSFNRGLVWSPQKQSSLVEFALMNASIGQIILNVVKDKDGRRCYVLLDGKQRITSLVSFLDGAIPISSALLSDIPLSCRDKGDKLWIHGVQPPSGSNGQRNERRLPRKIKDDLMASTVSACVYKNLSPQQMSILFTCAQGGTTLSSGEKLQALATPRSLYISGLQDLCDPSLVAAYGWKPHRDGILQIASFLAYSCGTGSTPTMAKVTAWLQEGSPFQADFMTKVTEVYKDFGSLAKNPTLATVVMSIGSCLVPIETVFAGVILFRFHEHSLIWKANTILALRKTLRQSSKSPRISRVQGEVAWTFIGKCNAEAQRPNATNAEATKRTTLDTPPTPSKPLRKTKKIDASLTPLPSILLKRKRDDA